MSAAPCVAQGTAGPAVPVTTRDSSVVDTIAARARGLGEAGCRIELRVDRRDSWPVDFEHQHVVGLFPLAAGREALLVRASAAHGVEQPAEGLSQPTASGQRFQRTSSVRSGGAGVAVTAPPHDGGLRTPPAHLRPARAGRGEGHRRAGHSHVGGPPPAGKQIPSPDVLLGVDLAAGEQLLGSMTFTCTDKAGALTCNEMPVIQVWTPNVRAEISAGGTGSRRRCRRR